MHVRLASIVDHAIAVAEPRLAPPDRAGVAAAALGVGQPRALVIAGAAMVGIDPDSDGLRRAQRLGVPTTAGGVRGLLDMPEFDDIAVVFDATSASAHIEAPLPR